MAKAHRDLGKRLLIPFAFLLSAECLGAIVIPIELEKGNPIASARINGVPVRLVVDTGGGLVTLKPETVAKVGAARTGSTSKYSDGHGNEDTQAILKLNALELGGNSFPNVEAADAGTYGAEAAGDGSIGRAFLNQFVAVYDYAARKISLFTASERSSADRECRGALVRTIPDPDNTIVSMAKTDHRTMRMTWDTGSTYSFVKKTFADTHKLPVENPFYTSQRFLLGEENFGPLQFVVLEFHNPDNVDGTIGYNFFAGHVVCIDPVRQVIRIRTN
jgi:Aspartyl protease